MDTYDYVSSNYFVYVQYTGDNHSELEELANRCSEDFYGFHDSEDMVTLQFANDDYEVPLGHFIVLDEYGPGEEIQVYEPYDFHEKFKPEDYFDKLEQGILDDTILVSGNGYLDTCVRVTAVLYSGYNFDEVKGLLPYDFHYYYTEDAERTLTFSSKGYHYKIPKDHYCVYNDGIQVYDSAVFHSLYKNVNYYGNLKRDILDTAEVRGA